MGANRGSCALSLTLLLAACGAPSSTGDSGGTTTGDDTTGDGSSSTSVADESSSGVVLPDLGMGTPNQTLDCANYVACAIAAMTDDAQSIEQMYGPDGACWETFDEAAECDAACEQGLADIVMQLETEGQPVPEECAPPATITWSELETMIADDCVTGCHEPGGSDQSLDLSTDVYNALYQVNSEQSLLYLIDPGSAADSYFWHKINGSQGSVGGMGGRMPRMADPWPQETIDAIGVWIDQGAPNF